MVSLHPDRLRHALAEIFQAGGSDAEEAGEVARQLVEADLYGHPSHGLGLVPMYLDHLANGSVRPGMEPVRVPDTGGILLYDGARGYGQSVGLKFVELVAAQVESAGSAVFALRNVHHLGRIGSYGERLAARGIASVAFVNVLSRPTVAVHGSARPRLGTNPVCIVVPYEEGRPLVLDFATSAVAVGKVRVALEAGRRLPEPVIVDTDGTPTDDPAVMYREPSGALLPFGGHKGGGLSVMCELLAALVGGLTMASPEAGTGKVYNTLVGMAFSTAAAGAHADLLAEAVAHIADFDPASGEEVLLPGDAERRSFARLSKSGVPIADAAWAMIVDRGTGYGVPRSAFDRCVVDAISAEP